jgi:hypothetical protein
MSFFKQKETKLPYSESNIIKILFDSGQDFGTDEERQECHKLEDDIKSRLSAADEYDGHEFGDGEVIIYVYTTDSADLLFERIKPALQKSDFNHIEIEKQYGPPDDPNTKSILVKL